MKKHSINTPRTDKEATDFAVIKLDIEVNPLWVADGRLPDLRDALSMFRAKVGDAEEPPDFPIARPFELRIEYRVNPEGDRWTVIGRIGGGAWRGYSADLIDLRYAVEVLETIERDDLYGATEPGASYGAAFDRRVEIDMGGSVWRNFMWSLGESEPGIEWSGEAVRETFEDEIIGLDGGFRKILDRAHTALAHLLNDWGYYMDRAFRFVG